MKKVLIIYRFLPHYRVDFYNMLRDELGKAGVELQLVYGKSKNTDALKNDEVDIEWAKYVPNRYMRIGKVELLWQPCLREIRGKDLVIVEGANKLLLNYYLMIVRHFSKFRLAVWGHGRNMQLNEGDVRNRYKYMFLNKCDCYFAYTEGVKDFLVSKGFPENKVVVVQNAIETIELKKFYESVTSNELDDLRKELNISGSNVGIYCGGMYYEKRIDFMIDACLRIKTEIPDFHMLFLGSGADAHKIISASRTYDWIHYIGPKFGNDRIRYFKISSLQLMPGLVGLGVLDSFALQTPLITTEYPYHSPEIEYLENNVNGMVTKNSLDDFSDTVISILKSGAYNELKAGCRVAGNKYTVQTMVGNFKNGILSCLDVK